MSRKRQQKPCEWCGAVGLLYKPRTRFCSRSCSMKARNHVRGGDEPIGTSKLSPNGYVMVKVQSRPTRWTQQHRIVLERVLGRPLHQREMVHHKNGVRSDNRPENLELWTLDHKDPAGVRVADLYISPHNTCGILSMMG